MEKYQDTNVATIARWIEEGWQWGVPIDHETYEKASKGIWDVLLTPTRPVPHEWFGDLEGKRLLGLADGGGQQMPVFTALGARCTVLDYCDSQLESERLVAQRESYDIDIVKADMTEPLPFEDGSFDLIFNPASLCYIEKVGPVLNECSRVLTDGGVLLVTFETGVNYIVDDDQRMIVRGLPFNPLEEPSLYREDDGYQFSHSLVEQLGGLLKAGFTITDLYEDTNGYGRLHELDIPSFIAVRAVKTGPHMLTSTQEKRR